MKLFGFTWGPKDANGCGPWWVPYEFKDEYFENECNIHDADYTNGVPRGIADKEFYRNMIKRIKKEPNRRIRYKRRLQALLFYYLVRRFGWLSYNG